MRPLAWAAALWGVLAASPVSAQQPVYRCEQGGRIGYSHEPCVGAKVIDATPTRGVDSMSGRRVPPPLSTVMEDSRRDWDKALYPLTGMNSQQMAIYRRRFNLPSADKAQCRQLDRQLPALETAAAVAPHGAEKAVAERQLFEARHAFYDLRC